MAPFGASSQNITVTGTVTDETGSPLPLVTVALKGASVGTASNNDGKYSIQVPKDGVLEFTFTGMATETVKIDGRTLINVVMHEDSQTLDEVVVIGYGSLEKRQVTSSITSLKPKDIVVGVGGATVGNSIKGKVSGLTMSGNDSPNTTNEFQMRGMASVNSSKGPLIVIDGIPGGDIRSIIAEDIQSMDFLKDASAGAIYGTRATGGVILITTKKGQAGKLRVGFTSESTYKQTFGKPEILNAEEYLTVFNRATDYKASTDWWDEALNPDKFSHRQLLNIQGGSEDAKFYVSLVHDKNNGTARGDTRKDIGGRINANFKMIDGWVELNADVDYRQANRDESSPSMQNTMVTDPTQPIYDANNPTGWNIYQSPVPSNGIADAALNTRNKLEKWFRPNAELKLNILPVKGLSARLTVGYENRQLEEHNYDSKYSTGQYFNKRTGEAYLKFEKEDLFNSDVYLSFDRVFGDHSINAVGGYSYSDWNKEKFDMRNRDFPVDGIKYWDMATGLDLKLGKAEISSHKDITTKLAAYFGRIHYGWKGKYIASASIRREASSKFAVNKRYGTFGQISAAWRISDELFVKDNVSWINDLKLRAAYGVTGNEGFSATYAAIMYEAYKVTLGTGESMAYYPNPSGEWRIGYKQSSNYNPDLGWEEKHEWNIGLDYSLFDDRIYGKLDMYRRQIVGLLYEANVPSPPYVTTRLMQNIGTLENRGIEFEIGGKIVKSDTWNYETSINLSHNVTKVGKMDEGRKIDGGSLYPNSTYRLEENVTVGSYYIYKHDRLEEISNLNPDGSYKDPNILDINGRVLDKTYDFVTVDKNGDGKIDVSEDRYYQGNYIPQIIAGWNHGLSYKNWQFNMTLTSWIKYDIYNAVEYYNGFAPKTSGKSPYNRLKMAYGKNVAIRPDNTLGYAPLSNYFLEDGTFLKIQNIYLGYTLHTRKYLKALDNIRFYLTVNNVYTFTGYSGYNPEVNITGWTGGSDDYLYPQTRSYAFGIQLNF
jgi:TonB-linked SusC/RagA family outer membrane protein